MPSKGSSKLRGLLRQIGAHAAIGTAGALLGGGGYLALHAMLPQPESTAPSTRPAVFYQTCREAFQDGRTNIRRGESGYRLGLDADQDGLACEPFIRR